MYKMHAANLSLNLKDPVYIASYTESTEKATNHFEDYYYN